MYIDLTLKINRQMLTEAMLLKNEALVGHAGTHFDVMNKEFPLNYTERTAIVFDVCGITNRDIGIEDVDLSQVEQDMFVAFRSGFHHKIAYGEPGYFDDHPQLSMELIDALLNKGISIIGIDFAGIRRTPEHIPTDQRCADKGVFVIENLRNLEAVLQAGGRFTAHTYPLFCENLTGLPCRVVAKVE